MFKKYILYNAEAIGDTQFDFYTLLIIQCWQKKWIQVFKCILDLVT